MTSDDIEEYSCRFLVVATEETTNAFMPHVEGINTFKGEVLHSRAFWWLGQEIRAWKFHLI